MRALLALLRDESGATMTEYAVILTLLSAASTALLVAISQNANSSINSVSNNMQSYQLGTGGVGPP